MKNIITASSQSFLTTLLPQQIDAVEHASRLRVSGLFMDMGTGKTRTAQELIAMRRHRINRAIYCCPVNLYGTILYEFKKHCPWLTIRHIDQADGSEDVVLVGLESVSQSNRTAVKLRELITKQSFVIVDESSFIKNHRSNRAKRLMAYSEDCQYRLIMTGRPVSLGAIDFFAQMKFLSPSVLGYSSFYSFARNHLEICPKTRRIVRSHNEEHLSRKMKPYIYQITREECLDLPERTFRRETVYLTGEQRTAYDEMKEKMLWEISISEDWSPCMLYLLFTRLTQIVSGFVIEDEENQVPRDLNNRRQDALMSFLHTIPGNEKSVIWCRYHRTIGKVALAIASEFGSQPALLHGGIKKNLREGELQKLRGQNRFIIATPETGGYGLDLTCVRHSIHFENSWDWAVREQSEARVWRNGQTQKTVFTSFCAENCIDERILKCLQRKENYARAFKSQMDLVTKKHRARVAMDIL